MNNQFITKELLEEYDIDTDGQDVDALLTHLNETLEERVGAEITDSLDEDMLAELLELQENGKDEEAGDWLEKNVPELKEIVQDEIDILLGELAENADSLNAA